MGLRSPVFRGIGGLCFALQKRDGAWLRTLWSLSHDWNLGMARIPDVEDFSIGIAIWPNCPAHI